MNRHLFAGLFAALMLMVGAQASAAIVIGPGGAACTSNDTSADNQESLLDTCFGAGTYTELYKSDSGASSGLGTDSGPYAGSYDTTFSNTATDPMDALVSWIGGSSITCPSCYLIVKDGNHTPAQYFFNISTWDGQTALDLQDFWPNGGAISHISIWGVGQQVPEPGTLALLGLGLAGIAFAGRRRG